MAAPSVSMLDVAAAEQKPLKRAVVRAMFEGTLPSPMDSLPRQKTESLSQQTIRLTDAGSPSTRHLGDDVAAYSAQFTRGEESLSIIENKITIDKVLLEQKSYVQDPLELQTRTYSLVVKHTVNDLLVNGNPGVDTTQPAGLDYRLRNDATFLAQSVNAAGLDIDASDANRYAWLDFIDEAIVLVRGHADMAIVNRQTWLKFRSALRSLKLFDTTKDQFDREIVKYGNVKVFDAGVKANSVLSAAAAGQIIPNDTSTSTFGTATSTPMYLLQTTGEDGVRLLELHPLRVQRIGLDTTNPAQFVIDVTWPIGFLTPHKFCLSSVQGLDVS